MAGITRSSWHSARVIENYRWTGRLFSLRLDFDIQSFKAGQFISLRLPIKQGDSNEVVAKSYSLINAPHEVGVEVFYNIVPDGRLSNALAQLQAGDEVEISRPAKGFFVLDEIPEVANLWMIATGTGLGPYLSILKTSAVWQRFQRLVLVHSVPLQAELAYQAQIQAFGEQYPQQFQFISCVTREANPQGLATRVTTALADGNLERHANLTISAENTHMMLCGNHNMLDEMKALLAKRNMQRHLRHKPGHITTEQYF